MYQDTWSTKGKKERKKEKEGISELSEWKKGVGWWESKKKRGGQKESERERKRVGERLWEREKVSRGEKGMIGGKARDREREK